MKYIVILVLSCVTISLYSQDTIYMSHSVDEFDNKIPIKDGFFHIETFDSTKKKWTLKHYNNNHLYLVEYLAEDKYLLIDSTTGYFPNGKLAFVKNYKFDGITSSLHGLKKTYFTNGKLKSQGDFYNDKKSGKWKKYDSLGNLLKTTEYRLSKIDSIPGIYNYSKINNSVISMDSVNILDYYSEQVGFLNLGKNGYEILYHKNIPVEVTFYLNGEAIFSVKKKKQILKLIDKETSQ